MVFDLPATWLAGSKKRLFALMKRTAVCMLFDDGSLIFRLRRSADPNRGPS
jgi:hypothetical protein